MPASILRTARFLRTWLTRRAPVVECEVRVEDEEVTLPATLLRERRSAPLPAWILLHGLTRPGRSHAELLRFARALASAGAVVVIPEIREWTQLRLAPDRALPAIVAAVAGLKESGLAREPPGVVGFSFGAPQALRAAATSDLRGRIGAVVGFGAYFDVTRTVRFQLTGEHEWKGRRCRLTPDPYGRWIMAANHLTDVPGHADAGDVSRALWRLAAQAGDRQVPADDPALDPLRDELRGEVAPSRRGLFDAFARRAGPAPEGARELGDALAAAALRKTPELHVTGCLGSVDCPVELVHGREDRLIPFTETLRLAAAFPAEAALQVTVTALFSHSRNRPIRAGVRAVREGWRFVRMLRRMVSLV